MMTAAARKQAPPAVAQKTAQIDEGQSVVPPEDGVVEMFDEGEEEAPPEIDDVE